MWALALSWITIARYAPRYISVGLIHLVPEKFCIRSGVPANEISRYQRLIIIILTKLIGDYRPGAPICFVPTQLLPTFYSIFRLCTAATLYPHEARAHAFRIPQVRHFGWCISHVPRKSSDAAVAATCKMHTCALPNFCLYVRPPHPAWAHLVLYNVAKKYAIQAL